MTELPPFLIFYGAAIMVALLPHRLGQVILLATPLTGGLVLLGMTADADLQWSIMNLVLEPLRVDRLSLLFGYLFHIAAFLGIVFSLHLRDRLQAITSLLYAGSALGAVFAGDLLTLFFFWEMLALTSAFLIFARKTERARRAGIRYLIIQVVSGVLLLAGALMLYR